MSENNKIGTYKFVAEPFHVDFTGRLTMGVLALLSVAMIALRFIHMRQEANSPKDEEYEY